MSRKTYIMVDHIHSCDDMPVRIYSELDENRYEVRKIELYRFIPKEITKEEFEEIWNEKVINAR